MDFDYKETHGGHQVVFTFYRDQAEIEAARVIDWLDGRGFREFAAPKTHMTWPSSKEFQVFRDSEGRAVFIRLFELNATDALLLKLTFGGA